jgi:hypothetical protein
MGDRRLMRSRWAAIGAAVAVSLAGGGVFIANAATSAPSSVVTIDPVRILDTRNDVGLPGPFVSPVSQKLQVTGAGVPVGATGVLMNVTVVAPSAAGFLSVRPGDASGAPTTSSLNFASNETLANSVQVALPTGGTNAGQIDITYDAYGQRGPSTEVLIDVVGYFAPSAAGSVNPRWAKVGLSTAGAGVLSGVGVVNAERVAVGVARVTFDETVTGCGWTATVNDNDRGGAASAGITVELGDLDNQLLVKTWQTNDGTAPWELPPGDNDGFTVMVICP